MNYQVSGKCKKLNRNFLLLFSVLALFCVSDSFALTPDGLGNGPGDGLGNTPKPAPAPPAPAPAPTPPDPCDQIESKVVCCQYYKVVIAGELPTGSKKCKWELYEQHKMNSKACCRKNKAFAQNPDVVGQPASAEAVEKEKCDTPIPTGSGAGRKSCVTGSEFDEVNEINYMLGLGV